MKTRKMTDKEKHDTKCISIGISIICGIITICLFITKHWILGIVGIVFTLIFIASSNISDDATIQIQELVYVAKGRKTYHFYKDCISIKGMPCSVISEKKAINQGYTLCSKCQRKHY